MIIHHYTQFGTKLLSSSGDTEQTQSDTQTELQTDRLTKSFQYPPPSRIYMGGINIGIHERNKTPSRQHTFKTENKNGLYHALTDKTQLPSPYTV